MEDIVRHDHGSGIVVGNPVTGGDFFDRVHELRELEQLIREGACILVTAPRRIGKTSLLLEARERLADSYAFLFVDVQSCTSEADCILKLAMEARDHRALGHKVLDAFRNVLGGTLSRIEEVGAVQLKIKLREGLIADWRAKADEIVDRLAEATEPVVVWFDELPVVVSVLLFGEDGELTPQRVDRARVFLSWLREATIRHRRKVCFVVSGSVGLEPLLARAGISETMTTFTPLPIGPWERETALAFIHDRSRRMGVEIDQDAANLLIDKLAYCIPHHVALFMHFIRRDGARRGQATCSRIDVERIYTRDMLSVHGHVDLATYEDRLKRVVPPETLRIALELLTEAAIVGRLSPQAARLIVEAHAPEGRESGATLRFLLGVFDHDGYLRRSGADYVFVSLLLRDWWRNRFGFGYEPALQRKASHE